MKKVCQTHSQRTQKRPVGRKEALWTVLFVAIAAVSIWTVTSRTREFSFQDFWGYLQNASWIWLALAALCMLAHIFFEGSAILHICRAFGYARKPRHGFVYASADIYFSAITPSATGGQPASAFFMINDGIPGTVSTVALLVNLMMYTLSIVLIGLFCFLIRPGIYSMFSSFARGMIVIGCIIQCGLALGFLLLLKKEKLVHRVCDGVLCLLAKLRLLRKLDQRRAHLSHAIDDYRRNVSLVSGQRRVLTRVFLLNVLQRTALICVTVCAFRAAGGARQQMLDAWTIQGFSIMGYNFVPIPGAMGVADLLMTDGFGQLMSRQNAVNLELLSRLISFYSCVIICGMTIVIRFILQKVRRTLQ